MKIAFIKPGLPAKGACVIAMCVGKTLPAPAQALDKAMGGGLKAAMAAADFTGAKGQTMMMYAPAGTRLNKVMLAGLGKPKELTDLTAREAGGRVRAALAKSAAVTVCVDAAAGAALSAAQIAAEMAMGANLRDYRFNKYRTTEKAADKPKIASVTFAVAGADGARKAYKTLAAVAEGVKATRDVVSEPPNVLYPEAYAREARKLSKLGVKVEVLGEAQMKKLGMGALLGVGQGSRRESKLVVMQWKGARGRGKKEGPVAIVGKGVTFDTGGISLKPAGGMEDMKWDMGGSGVVLGLMKALALRKAKVDVIGVAGMVENMPDGNAQRPGDIVTSMSGQTIEVLNTDAEGRLVLADALWYTNKRFKPCAMVNLATLTGAVIISLGDEYAGLFSNNDKLAANLKIAGDATGEKLWRLPLHEAYDKTLNTDAADMKNISSGRGAGSITAAQFLQRFVGGTPWAHLDIAGVTWSKKDAPAVPKGATAFGVQLLDCMIAKNYEG
ncbi:MAG: leucyl aminopeptidase [Rhodospirillales bacterium]